MSNAAASQPIVSQKLGGLAYAGDVSPAEAYRVLSQEGGFLVDVRSLPEWQFTGVANLEGMPAKLLTISWKTYPNFVLNPEFEKQLASAVGAQKDVPIFFLCKTGGRSLDAAVAMTQAGYSQSYNVTGGFEGDQNESGQRGTKNGWKAAQLPWAQG
jgi:rhodanese-related sulfurtransferase